MVHSTIRVSKNHIQFTEKLYEIKYFIGYKRRDKSADVVGISGRRDGGEAQFQFSAFRAQAAGCSLRHRDCYRHSRICVGTCRDNIPRGGPSLMANKPALDKFPPFSSLVLLCFYSNILSFRPPTAMASAQILCLEYPPVDIWRYWNGLAANIGLFSWYSQMSLLQFPNAVASNYPRYYFILLWQHAV